MDFIGSMDGERRVSFDGSSEISVEVYLNGVTGIDQIATGKELRRQ
jgi:hypothetical protein